MTSAPLSTFDPAAPIRLSDLASAPAPIRPAHSGPGATASPEAAAEPADASLRRLADLGLSLAKVTHDLRNLLAAAQLMTEGLDAVEDVAARRVGRRLGAVLERAAGYAEGLLAYARAGDTPPDRTAVPVRALVDVVADTLELAREDGPRFRNGVPADLFAHADPDQLFRILFNLLRNAVEVLGSQPAQSRRLGVAAERRGDLVRLLVWDTGPGVAVQARETLFTPFRGSRRPGGTGLGLPIAAELAAAHGGFVRLVDGGPGAVFEVVIPDLDATSAYRPWPGAAHQVPSEVEPR